MINATIFAQYASALVGSYSASYTDALVWWFASSNQTVQADAVSQICSSKYYSVKDAIFILWNLNATFVLDQTLQTTMINNVDKMSNGSMTASYINQNPIKAYEIFSWNPYTPKSYLWFQNQGAFQQRVAINAACYYSTVFPARFWNTTIQFYHQWGSVSYAESVENAMSDCVGISRFLESPALESSKSWLTAQRYVTQRTSIFRLCSKQAYNTTQLNKLLSFYNMTEARIQSDQQACINTHKCPEALVWLASQNSSVQATAVGNLCMSRVMAGGRVYTLQEIYDMLENMKQFLNSTSLLSNKVISAVDNCAPFYSGRELSTWVEYADFPQTRTWVASQSESMQLAFFGLLCLNTTLIDDEDLMYMFHQYGAGIPLSLDVQYQMTTCPRIWQQLDIYTSRMYFFWGFLGVSCAGIVVFSAIATYEILVTRSKQSISHRVLSPFNTATLFCFMANAVEDYCNVLVWQRGAISFVTTANLSVSQQYLNLGAELFANLWAISYLYFCWMRSETILNDVWPKTVRWIRIAFYISPVLLLCPIVMRGLSLFGFNEDAFTKPMDSLYSKYLFYLQAVSASTLMAIDAILGLTFTRYIRKVYSDLSTSDISPRFLIISRYGIVASILCFLFAGMSITRLISTAVAFTLEFRLTYSGCKHAVTILLLLMKVSLLSDSVKEVSKGSHSTKATEPSSSGYQMQKAQTL
ncbi:hypothetical protein BDR26DRAFT_867533 [Obelidium mucronatum]|nr:hypothetical protein BDR26DRAFT_867533 [Obelidium mucronatum]